MSSFTDPNKKFTFEFVRSLEVINDEIPATHGRSSLAWTPTASPATNPPPTPAPTPRVVSDGRLGSSTFGYRRTGNYRLQRYPDGAARVLMIWGHGDGNDYLSVAYIQDADREMLAFLEDVLGVL